ncbi:hypothetical protein [uncultured Spirosoma sp.]|nr:hypothetical protein [uncultured Spirosoma sp.]
MCWLIVYVPLSVAAIYMLWRVRQKHIKEIERLTMRLRVANLSRLVSLAQVALLAYSNHTKKNN